MSQNSLAKNLRDALTSGVESCSEVEALTVAKTCLEKHLPAGLLIQSISEAFKTIGDKFAKGAYYLPELMFAGTMTQKVLEILGPVLSLGDPGKTRGRVVIGTVRGDIHDLGKNIVTLMLRPEGFHVIDLGSDVPPEKFAEAVASERANILCMSALLSTTRDGMKIAVQELKKRGIREKVKVVVGGGAIDQSFAKEVGADAYGRDAIEAVKLCKSFAGS